jgi:hypothetical protein
MFEKVHIYTYLLQILRWKLFQNMIPWNVVIYTQLIMTNHLFDHLLDLRNHQTLCYRIFYGRLSGRTHKNNPRENLQTSEQYPIKSNTSKHKGSKKQKKWTTNFNFARSSSKYMYNRTSSKLTRNWILIYWELHPWSIILYFCSGISNLFYNWTW